jgi:hypothetical protein
MKGNLLLNEEPLIILPGLAEEIGLNEAIVIQQIHYWLKRTNHYYDEKLWVYNTYEEWQEQFRWWSISTIRRTLKNLEDMNLVISGNYNRLPIDKTKWYTINYDLIEGLSSPSVQYEQSKRSKRTVEGSNVNRPLPEITTETTTKTTNIRDKKNSPKPKPRFDESSPYFILANFFLEQIRVNKPNYREPNMQKWSDTLRLIVEQDERTLDHLKKLIIWVQRNDFWKANVLSPAKLRKQLDTLEMQMEQESNRKNRSPFPSDDELPDWIKNDTRDYGF